MVGQANQRAVAAVRSVLQSLSRLEAGRLYSFDDQDEVYWLAGFDQKERSLLNHVAEEVFREAGYGTPDLRVVQRIPALPYDTQDRGAMVHDIGDLCSRAR